jgi:hypothetical protein
VGEDGHLPGPHHARGKQRLEQPQGSVVRQQDIECFCHISQLVAEAVLPHCLRFIVRRGRDMDRRLRPLVPKGPLPPRPLSREPADETTNRRRIGALVACNACRAKRTAVRRVLGFAWPASCAIC